MKRSLEAFRGVLEAFSVGLTVSSPAFYKTFPFAFCISRIQKKKEKVKFSFSLATISWRADISCKIFSFYFFKFPSFNFALFCSQTEKIEAPMALYILASLSITNSRLSRRDSTYSKYFRNSRDFRTKT